MVVRTWCGMQLLAEDIERGSGHLKIRQTDTTKFEIGTNLAITPGKVIFRMDGADPVQLRRPRKS